MASLFPALALGTHSWMVTTFPVLLNLFLITNTLYWKLKAGFLQGAFPLFVSSPLLVNLQAECQADISAITSPYPPLFPRYQFTPDFLLSSEASMAIFA